jgi:hypothetical protein
MDILENYSVTRRKPEQVDVQENNVRRIFGGMISREYYKEPKLSPCRDFFGIKNMKQGKWRLEERVQVDVPLSNMGLNLFKGDKNLLEKGFLVPTKKE